MAFLFLVAGRVIPSLAAGPDVAAFADDLRNRSGFVGRGHCRGADRDHWEDLAQPVVLSSDGLGKFASPELKPGTYSVRVTRDGFEPLVKTVDLQGSVQLQLTLTIAKQQVSISVAGKSLAFANSDPVYRQLREIGLGQTFRFDNFTLTWDAATFQFQKGTLTFLSPVNGVVTGAIFIGEGHFNLKPVTPLDARELTRRTGAAEVNEDFTEVVFRFTGEARLKFLCRTGGSNGNAARGGSLSSTTGKRRCDSAGSRRWALPSICCRAKPWTTWTPTFWLLSTIARIRNSSMPISAARSTRISVSS